MDLARFVNGSLQIIRRSVLSIVILYLELSSGDVNDINLGSEEILVISELMYLQSGTHDD